MMDRIKAFAAILVGTILFSGSLALAHKPLLSVEDNQDGTIGIEAGFSDGSSAAGHKIILKDDKTGAVISEHRVGEDGTLQLKKPPVAYTLTLDAGEGHVVSRPGPTLSSSESAGGSRKDEAESSPVVPGAGDSKPAPVPSEPVKPPGEQVTGVQSSSRAQGGPEISPGAVMAFKMMITVQIVTATALIILLAAVAFFFGYTFGKKTGSAENT